MRCAEKVFVLLKTWAKSKPFHLIRPFGAPSPQGEGFGLCIYEQNDKSEFVIQDQEGIYGY